MSQIIGSPSGLRFQFEWHFSSQYKTANGATYGGCYVWLGEELIWGNLEKNAPVDWNWVQLLEFLSDAWSWLIYEETYPIPINPLKPTLMRQEAEYRWEQMSDSEELGEDTALYEFESMHNLAYGLEGIHLPSLFLLRQGQEFLLNSEDVTLYQPVAEVKNTLKAVGDLLYKRLEKLTDPHSVAVKQLWDSTHDGTEPHVPIIKIVTNLSDKLFEELKTWLPNIHSEEDINELHVAARMTGMLQTEEIQKILQTIMQLSPGDTTILDNFSQKAGKVLQHCSNEKPYEQGYELAGWLREELNIAGDAKINPQEILVRWGVDVTETNNLDEELQALACWGKQRGPAVLLNPNGRFSNNPMGRNATLAHEICHLLVDRQGALPFVEVLGGNMPKRIEQRANAFAAELLLPRRQAAFIAQQTPNTTKPEELTQLLQNQFDVSKQVAANQLLNSTVYSALDEHVKRFLEKIRNSGIIF